MSKAFQITFASFLMTVLSTSLTAVPTGLPYSQPFEILLQLPSSYLIALIIMLLIFVLLLFFSYWSFMAQIK